MNPISAPELTYLASNICAGIWQPLAFIAAAMLFHSLFMHIWRETHDMFFDSVEEKRKNDEKPKTTELTEKPKRKPVRFKLGDDGELVPADDDELSLDELLEAKTSHED